MCGVYVNICYIIFSVSVSAAKPHYDGEIVTAFFEESDFLIDR